MLDSVMGDAVDVSNGTPAFDQMRVNYTKWAMDMHARFHEGLEEDDVMQYEVMALDELPAFKALRKKNTVYRVMQRQKFGKKRRNSVQRIENGAPVGAPRRTLVEKPHVRRFFIDKQPEGYEVRFRKPMREVTFEPPVMPEIIRDDYKPSPFVAGYTAQDFERKKAIEKDKYENALTEAQFQYEQDMA